MDAVLAENIFVSEESTPEPSRVASLPDCEKPPEEISARSTRVKSWLGTARAGDTDYPVIILTAWGRGSLMEL